MHEIAFARTLCRLYKFRPDTDSIRQLRYKLASVAQSGLSQQEKQYMTSSLADLANQMKALLGDYHKWFGKNVDEMEPTLELFAYAKFLWDFVSKIFSDIEEY